MAQIFDRIKLSRPKSSVFDLSHEKKLSLNMGDLVPIFMQETLPGDQFKVNIEHLIRFQPLLAPIMHRVNVYTHFFFVPNRLIWNDWEKFITGGSDGEQSPVFPRFKFDTDSDIHKSKFRKGSLADYLGYPSSNISQSGVLNIDISALPFRAYQLIYNEYYRDQNLTNPIEFSKSSGLLNSSEPEFSNLLSLRKRAWEKDYFTSALPWAQRGEQLNIPIAGTAPVIGTGDDYISLEHVASGNLSAQDGYMVDSQGYNVEFKTKPQGLEADLNNVSASSINELRQAFSIQKWLEKNARGGSRYVEQLLAHFGVHSSDASLS